MGKKQKRKKFIYTDKRGEASSSKCPGNLSRRALYYDGSCPMCTAVVGKVEGSLGKETFDLKDITKDPLPRGIPRERAEREMHVVGPNGQIHKNVDALLRIVEESPRWRFLARVACLPIIKQLLKLGYRFVALNRHVIFGPISRVFWLKIAVVGSLFAGLLLSVRLWIGFRVFPRAPFGNILSLPPFFETILFVVLVVLLAVVFVRPKPRKLIFLALALVGVFILFDQMRWQPWFYQYVFMLAALGLFSWNPGDIQRQKDVLNIARLIVASIYFYSGLQKLNPAFIVDAFPWIAQPVIELFPPSLQILPFSFGVIVPFLEMGIGIGLISKKYRKYAVALAVLTSGFVLYAIGPFGRSWNSIVWPWNIAMVLFVVILFWRPEPFSVRDVLWKKGLPFQKVVLLLFGVIPFFNLFGAWDSYLSFALYSGNTSSAQIYVTGSVQERLPAVARVHTEKTSGNVNTLDFFHWSFDELNAPPYPETRVYKDIAESICKYATNEQGVFLVVNGKKALFGIESRSVYDCQSLHL